LKACCKDFVSDCLYVTGFLPGQVENKWQHGFGYEVERITVGGQSQIVIFKPCINSLAYGHHIKFRKIT
jgi:hypothetical protein